MKNWRVSDLETCNEEDFATEQEALEYAKEILDGHREEAKSEGEWSPDVSELKIYKVTHSAQRFTEGCGDGGLWWADYAIMPIFEEKQMKHDPEEGPQYDYRCTSCRKPCNRVETSFDYAGTHCTGGVGGTHCTGEFVSDCCGEEVEEIYV